MAALEKELLDSLAALDADQRRQVLEYARALGSTSEHGVPGCALLRFAGAMSEEDARELRDAIAKGSAQPDG